tara:strand:+ start:3311 stop:3700 length:390 start_codon:yes stop_codon:yes gene_type:complete
MQFCENCDNMLYFKITNSDTINENDEVQSSEQLYYYCRCCGNKHENIKNIQHSVYSINYNTDHIKKQSVINKYTHNDPTLPKTIGIKCPNIKCPSKSPEIIYINYDEVNMNYIYMCLDCKKNNIEPNVW